LNVKARARCLTNANENKRERPYTAVKLERVRRSERAREQVIFSFFLSEKEVFLFGVSVGEVKESFKKKEG